MFRQLIPLTMIFALMPAVAQAYIGPGMGLGRCEAGGHQQHGKGAQAARVAQAEGR